MRSQALGGVGGRPGNSILAAESNWQLQFTKDIDHTRASLSFPNGFRVATSSSPSEGCHSSPFGGVDVCRGLNEHVDDGKIAAVGCGSQRQATGRVGHVCPDVGTGQKQLGQLGLLRACGQEEGGLAFVTLDVYLNGVVRKIRGCFIQ